MQRGTQVLLVLLMALVGGCATNPFAEFYQDQIGKMPASMQRRLFPPSNAPELFATTSTGAQDDYRHLVERGYALIGFSTFLGAMADRDQLIGQAKKVGAEIVLYGSDFAYSEQGVLPYSSYQAGQTLTTQHFGTIGDYTYMGTSTTTTPGTYQTQLIPYQRQVFVQGASFWRRLKPGILGVNFGPLPDELKAKLQRNGGVVVIAVVEDSPAFRANIIRDDIIIRVSDREIPTVEAMNDALNALAGQTVPIQIIRGSDKLTIELQLNNSP